MTLEELEARIPHGKTRTRFAPSPTGYMHVGNLRTALYTWLIARHNGGTFILRIEDTDQNRFVEGATEVIYRTLKECGLDHDEGPDIGGPVGPYIQSERRELYKLYANALLEKGAAYRCFCEKCASEEDSGEFDREDDPCRNLSRAESDAKAAAGEPYVIRQKIPREGSTTFHDVSFGDITVDNAEMDDQVLLKRDGLPTYNFANVVDDHLMGITHVVRGSEYLASAPKYNLLYEAFGWEIPAYVHCSPVMRDAHNKMSKRHGDPSYEAGLFDAGGTQLRGLTGLVSAWRTGRKGVFHAGGAFRRVRYCGNLEIPGDIRHGQADVFQRGVSARHDPGRVRKRRRTV